MSIISFRNLDKDVTSNADLTGPLIVAFALGCLLLLNGKLHFSYIYGFGVCGTVGIFVILKSMMTSHDGVYLYTTMSVLGYCLMPFVILAILVLFLSPMNIFGIVASLFTVTWSTYSATLFLDAELNMSHKKCLIAYPIFLFYLCFLLLTIF